MRTYEGDCAGKLTCCKEEEWEQNQTMEQEIRGKAKGIGVHKELQNTRVIALYSFFIDYASSYTEFENLSSKDYSRALVTSG